MPDNKSPDDLRSRYKAIKEERQRRINEHKRSIAARPATATNLKILADGDSWFKYSPSMDVIDFIHQDGNPPPFLLNLDFYSLLRFCPTNRSGSLSRYYN